ncbi:hypothetical protein KOR34_45310 [Posidoniimonas corsicana]|uniref:Phage-related minor tail protein n=1 Tax=Posidoniimonas corsicana TaxID=1938618 RepID=A0A5C5V0A3_9BACT|nr:hypothetical protein [Posidoniimonas corsicana]TWT31155.1 hypothetical protein KOR34_45310 [Posidoniimonas corsicana]
MLKTDSDVRGIKRFNTELGKTDKELDEITKGFKGAAGQARKLAEQAEPMKRVTRQMATLAKHVKAGRLSMEDAEKLAGKYQRQLDRVSTSGQKAVGPGMAGNITSLVGGYVSLAGAVGTVTKALTEMEQQAQEAADATFAGLGSIGELQQISNGDPKQFQKNLGFARSLVARGVFSEIGAASDATFSLGSAGFSDAEKEFLASLAEKKIVKSEGLVGFGGALRKAQGLYGGKVGVEGTTDRILATSAATQANATQTALATSQFAAASQELGFSGDAALAGLVLVEEKAKNIDEAATQMANLLDAIDQRKLGKGTFKETIAGIQAQVDAGAGAFDVLGNKRAVKGFRAISSQIGEFDAQVSAISGSGGASLRADVLGSDPIARAAALRESATGRATAARDSLTSEPELLMDAVIAEKRAYRLSQGREAAATFLGWGDRWSDWTGSESIAMARAIGAGMLTPATEQAAAAYLLNSVEQVPNGTSLEYLRRIAEGVEKGGGAGRQE